MSDSKSNAACGIVGGVLIVAFLAYGATSFKSNLTPYVSFEEAQRAPRKVQVAGGLVPDSTIFLEESETLQFGMVEEDGDTMTVLLIRVQSRGTSRKRSRSSPSGPIPRGHFMRTSCWSNALRSIRAWKRHREATAPKPSRVPLVRAFRIDCRRAPAPAMSSS